MSLEHAHVHLGMQMPVNHSASYQDQFGRFHPIEWYGFGECSQAELM